MTEPKKEKTAWWFWIILGVALWVTLFSSSGCHTIQTGPACDLTPYNDSMATQMGFMLIDQLPRLLR